MGKDNALDVAALIISILALVCVAVFILMPQDKVDLDPVYEELDEHAVAINQVGMDLSNAVKDLTVSIGDQPDYDDEIEDLEEAVDKNHDDINDLEDVLECIQECNNLSCVQDC